MSREKLPIKPQAGLRIEEFDIASRGDGHPIHVRVYRKSGSKDLPLIVYMHGGGFVTGSLETDDRYCRRIAAEADAIVLSVDYRLAPENRFPVGFEDAFDVV